MSTGLSTLPIDGRLEAIVASVRAERSLVLVAEPGAGKTTRVPRALLDAGFADAGEILVLEPRRLAVRMAARRVSEELGEAVGGRVGYQVRFEQKTSARTRVRFITEGILARRLTHDPKLRGVSTVIFDEFHERHLHSDLGLAQVRALQRTSRPELCLVVMSATMEAEPVAGFLGCPIVEALGRAYPVEVDYLPAPDERRLEKLVEVALRRLTRDGADGDVLVFLPGAGEIRRAQENCAPVCAQRGMDLVLLHGDLPASEQDRAVRPGRRPKLILSTNVAETSVTIPSVVSVIDSGLARIARHSPWTGLPTLETAKISQASAKQRAGRAGRTGPGRCLRLYTEHDHRTRQAHDEPEIRRVDLAETVLSLRAAGHDPERFDYFEPPPIAALAAATGLLRSLGAVDEDELTERGQKMLKLPVHPRLARLALEADERGVGPRGCLVAALVGEREIRRAARTSFGPNAMRHDEVGGSDLLARLEAFEAAEVDGISARTCKAHGLEVASTLSVARARDQLTRALRCGAVAEASLMDEEEALLISTLAAFPDRVGKRREARSDAVVLSGGGSAKLSPVSVVREAELMVAVDVAKQRGAPIIRAASAIEAEWLLELFEAKVEHSVELRFDPETEQVERVASLRFDGLVLDESVRRDVEGADVAEVLAEAAVLHGVGKLWDADAIERLACRFDFARAEGLGIDPLDDATLRHAVAELAVGHRSFKDLRRLPLVEHLLGRLEPALSARLRSFAPETVSIGGRPRVPVEYERERAPWIQSRMQDFFGMKDGPSVAEGRVPLVLHLLAPNRRAVQVSTDLAGFWERHYPAIRKELMRRYPRHAWPEEPSTAKPSKPKRRKRR